MPRFTRSRRTTRKRGQRSFRRAGNMRRRVRTNAVGITRSLASLTHMFKREGAVVRINNTGMGAAAYLNTTANGWQLSYQANDTFASTQQFGIAASFRLKDVLTPTDFTDLFDRYKIVKVVLKMMYQSNVSSAYPGSDLLPIINYSFDADDAEVPPNLETVTTKGYCKNRVLNANRPFSWVCKPRIDKQIYNDGITTAYSSERACWIDCQNPTVQHFAFKAWVNNFPLGQGDAGIMSQLTIQPIYYLAFKDSQ